MAKKQEPKQTQKGVVVKKGRVEFTEIPTKEKKKK